MLISTEWIKEFVELGSLDSKTIGNAVTLATAEVEDVIVKGDFLKNITVVEIVTVNKHPEADKLNLVTFKISADKTKEVVCGASNVRPGLKVPYAKVGVKLPSGLLLEPKKIRGILSEGMLCSSTELGLGEESKGLLELPATAEVGLDLYTFLKATSDIVLDIDNKSLTHRPDLWGHYGFAREFATIFDKPLKNPFHEKWQSNIKAKFSGDKAPIIPEVNLNSAGLGYFGISIDGISVTESPDWIKNKLEILGLRSINSIVDISNYVMLELGMPLHIFDRQKISGDKVFINSLSAPVKFTTLDGIERILVEGDTVISDLTGPLVIGGIMGGLSSGVDQNTKNIFIEVANWKPSLVRKTSTRLGLRTDSSQRYEKTLDSLLLERTLYRTIDLVLQLNPNAKIIGKPQYSGMNLTDIKSITVKTSIERILKKLGSSIEKEKIIKILTSLDFKVENKGDELQITVPSFRATKDVDVEDDIVEEIGRMIGFDNIKPVSPMGDIKAVRLTPHIELKRKIQDFMVNSAHALEVMTYPLVSEKLLKKSKWENLNDELTLVNSLSIDHDRMRPSLVPSFFNLISENAKYFERFRCFELGRSYLFDTKTFSAETNQLVVCFYSETDNQFIQLENEIEKLLHTMKLSFEFIAFQEKFPNKVINHSWIGLHPNEKINLKIFGQNCGAIFSIHPILLREFKIRGNVHLAIIDLANFENRDTKNSKFKYQSLPKFPSSQFDCTVVSDKDKNSEEILTVLRSLKIKEITDIRILDIFKMSEIQKAITLRCVFYDPENTLTSDLIKNLEQTIVKTLENANFPLR